MKKVVVIILIVGGLFLLRNLAYDFQEYVWKVDGLYEKRMSQIVD